MEFDLEPYVGARPVKFGMKAADVAKTIGAAESDRTVRDIRVEYRLDERKTPMPPVRVYYSAADEVVEIEFEKGSVLKYDGVDLFKQKDILKVLAAKRSAQGTRRHGCFSEVGNSDARISRSV
jgi:hypothetical protein